MSITKSAKKALRQNIKRKLRNRRIKTKIKNLIKEVKVLVSQKKIEEAKKLLPSLYKILDKAAKTNLLKKNTVSRKKSRITKAIQRALNSRNQ
ncbi:hypothetical protein AMJ49_03745 [Parcubacteria bacterium DG_74_2]|nr:MAG: hypothetical protein AMJ49_03745 [Parcubacteria bacterium DG_74_2]